MRIFTNSAITVGAFDGVHLGHQEILSRLKAKAHEISADTLVVTFWPHPSHVLGSKPLKLINSLEEKISLIKNMGIDEVMVLPFTHEFSKINSYDFIKEYLIKQFGLKFFLLGYNHHFGNDRQGDIHVIRQYGSELGFEVEKAGSVEINGEKVSSTKIRNSLSEGLIELANNFLGYSFFLQGTVAKGQMIGRTIGFPTANIQLDEPQKIIPKDGVYAVLVEIAGQTFPGMLNIGHRPTVNSDKHLKTIEVHIINFNKDVYGEDIKVSFLKRIRDEVKFTGIEILKNQLHIDKKNVTDFLASKF